MKIATYLIILLAAFTTAVIAVKSMMHPITTAAGGFIVWSISPYACLLLMAKLASTLAARWAVVVLSFLVGSSGVWLIVDAMFISLDAQGGLIYFFLPVWQWAFLMVGSIPVYFLNKKTRNCN